MAVQKTWCWLILYQYGHIKALHQKNYVIFNVVWAIICLITYVQIK